MESGTEKTLADFCFFADNDKPWAMERVLHSVGKWVEAIDTYGGEYLSKVAGTNPSGDFTAVEKDKAVKQFAEIRVKIIADFKTIRTNISDRNRIKEVLQSFANLLRYDIRSFLHLYTHLKEKNEISHPELDKKEKVKNEVIHLFDTLFRNMMKSNLEVYGLNNNSTHPDKKSSRNNSQGSKPPSSRS